MTRNVLAFAAVLAAASWCFAETYTGEASNRLDINMGITPWKFATGDPVGASTTGFADGGWKTVGVPHCVNQDDSYTNCESGGTNQFGGTMWYRKHFSLDQALSSRKVFVEFQGAHVGAAVYINGTFIPGNSALNPACTHVIGFIPFIVDITQYVQFGGADNVLAVKVSNGGGMYADPGFSTEFRFGQHDGGLVRPVWMHVTDKVYVPANIYSVVKKWGTCVGAVTANDALAQVRIMTNVQNEGAAAQTVTVTTKVVDASNTVALSMDQTQAIAAGGSFVFDQTGNVVNPHLWYPAASIYGKPYMYKVYHIVKVAGATVDVFQSPLGIRVITWDHDYPYVNGHQHYMWGMSGRYDYPALGSGLPDGILWRDAKLTADIGGRIWRPGHSTCAHEFVDACDAFGVMLDQPSGEGEGAFSTTAINANKILLKSELHRDMIVRDRNNPSILMWEVSNAGIDPAFADSLKLLALVWDPILKRPQADRGYLEACRAGVSDVVECSSDGCEIGQKLNPACPNYPAFGAEGWGNRSSRWAWDFELAFASDYIQNWKNDIVNKAFGLAHWYLAEAPGEVGNLDGSNGLVARSFGSSAMDCSRFPKLLYYIYRAAWVPFSVQPNVVLAHHWNRTGTVQVNAFSNCPKVRLLLNGTLVSEKAPNPWNGTGDERNNQNTTQLPFQVYWSVAWAAGTLRAEGLDSSGKVVCSDEKKTAGAPDHILLTIDPQVVKPDGSVFNVTANGTDVFTVTATVVDANGVWCPTASNIITFAVSGPCEYRGGSDQFVTAGQPLGYHSPLDPNLLAEGGMCRAAVRATFTPGNETVTASSGSLSSNSVSQTILPVSAGPTSVYRPVMPLDRVGTAPTIKIGTYGSMLRYFVGRPAAVSVEVLDASGRELRRIAAPRLDAGWHSLQMRDAGNSTGTGVYFVRITVDGSYRCVRPVVMMR